MAGGQDYIQTRVLGSDDALWTIGTAAIHLLIHIFLFTDPLCLQTDSLLHVSTADGY